MNYKGKAMTREIKFRGLRTDGKGWVYGSYDWNWKHVNKYYIYELNNRKIIGHEVIPETVGQFTGLTDKNGIKIYEGDTVRYTTTVKTNDVGDPLNYDGEVQFWVGQSGCGWRYKSNRYTMMIKHSHAWGSMTVTGNIHEQNNNEQKTS